MFSATTARVLRQTRPLFFGLAIVLGSLTMPANAATYRVLVNGVHLAVAQAPFQRGGRVFVPLRAIFEGLSAGVAYDRGTINATAGDKTVQLQIGSNQAIVGGRQVYLDAAPFLQGSTAMVPLRFISEALGAHVDFNNQSGAISVAAAKLPIPNGAVINATLMTELNSASAYIGQPVTLSVPQSGLGNPAALAGATIYGKVIQAQAAAQGTNPIIQIAVDSIALPGSTDPQSLSAKVLKIDPIHGSAIAKEVGATIGGMLLGNWIGKALDTNQGGLIGAAGAYLLTANSKTNIRVPSGAPVTLQLTDALALM